MAKGWTLDIGWRPGCGRYVCGCGSVATRPCSKRRYPVPLPLTVTDLNSNLGLCAAAVSVSARAVDRRRQTSNLSLARWQSRIQGQGQPETLVAGFTLKRRRAISKNCVPRRNEMQCGWRLFAVVSVAVGRGGFLESSFLVEVVRRTTRASTRVFHLRPGNTETAPIQPHNTQYPLLPLTQGHTLQCTIFVFLSHWLYTAKKFHRLLLPLQQ